MNTGFLKALLCRVEGWVKENILQIFGHVGGSETPGNALFGKNQNNLKAQNDPETVEMCLYSAWECPLKFSAL